MKISIIILAHNNYDNLVKYILPAIKFQVSNFEYEVILVNNSNVEKERSKINNIEFNNLNILNISENTNRGKSRNFGVKHSKYDYLLFLDGDIIINNMYFYNLKKYLEDNSVLFGKVNTIKEEHIELKNIIELSMFTDIKNDALWQKARSNNFFCTKDSFNEVGKFDTIFEGWGYEDTDLFYRFHKKGFNLIRIYDLISYHISHKVDFDSNLKGCINNYKLMLKKHPELGNNYNFVNRHRNLIRYLKGVLKAKEKAEAKV